ncbi:hypothetical protein N9L68_02530 [bacterium]|nr:hypothetical protein [bacterium]
MTHAFERKITAEKAERVLPPGRAPPPRPIYSTAVTEGQVNEQAGAIGTRPGAAGTPIDDTTAIGAAWAWCKQIGEVGGRNHYAKTSELTDAG